MNANSLTLMQTLVPVLVPVLIAVLKHFIPTLPKPWLPVLAPLLGGLLEALASGQIGSGTALGAVLGSAGVGLRELLDQVRKCMGSGGDAPPPGGRLTLLLLSALLPLAVPACKTTDETAFKAAATLEATVDRAMTSWASYVVWKRQAGTSPAELLQLDDQERTVRRAHATYRLAMNAAYDARAAWLLDKRAGLPEWQAALDAARAAAASLVNLIELHTP